MDFCSKKPFDERTFEELSDAEFKIIPHLEAILKKHIQKSLPPLKQ